MNTQMETAIAKRQMPSEAIAKIMTMGRKVVVA
jgi:hypothetical protein